MTCIGDVVGYRILYRFSCCFNVQTDDLTNRFQQEVATLYGTWILVQSDTGESVNWINMNGNTH